MGNNQNLKASIGERVRSYRLEKKLTQAEFAEIMDISINFLSEIENGKKGMSQDTICKLCNHFHISADYILFGNSSLGKTADTKVIIKIANSMSDNDLNVLVEYLSSLQKIRSLEFEYSDENHDIE